MYVFDGKKLNFHFWDSPFSGIAVVFRIQYSGLIHRPNAGFPVFSAHPESWSGIYTGTKINQKIKRPPKEPKLSLPKMSCIYFHSLFERTRNFHVNAWQFVYSTLEEFQSVTGVNKPYAPFTQDADHLTTGVSKVYMGHTVVNGSVHTGCKQHQRVCTQICMRICLRVLCEQGLWFL